MRLIALKMLLGRPARFALTVSGIGVAFFLTAAQVGLLVGWCRTTTAIVRKAGVDLWVMAQKTPAFDYGTSISRSRIYQVRSVPGVAWAEGMFMAWNIWSRPDGRRVNIELVGLDDSTVGGPWAMRDGSVESVHQPDTVIVDELYSASLGVKTIGDTVEILGTRAKIGGISREVRTFTASPFVFTSIPTAIKYDKRYQSDEITYVLVRCAPGVPPRHLKEAIIKRVADVDVYTTAEFARLTIRYWMLETGVGITVVLTAVLGLCIGTIITSQTLYAITQDHLRDYTTLLAIGFPTSALTGAILWQSLLLASCGAVVGSALFFPSAWYSSTSPVPMETTPLIFAGLLLGMFLTCVIASLMSVRSLYRIDPVTVFQGA
jgi:putative ABC transport system permease protein